jgi:pyruvate dehydrogenase E2 component (dihydrolipoamide acetyltransferase)
MATPVEMPKLGNTVEECILASWKKPKGAAVSEGEIIAEIETDKANFELAAPTSGTLLEVFFGEGELIPVFTNICVIGNPGENVEQFRPSEKAAPAQAKAEPSPAAAPSHVGTQAAPAAPSPVAASGEAFLSPRARRLAAELGYLPALPAGSGPGGRILESDLRAAYAAAPRVSSLARQQMAEGYEARHAGSGINGMILARDLDAPPLRMSGIRGRIAQRMRESLATTAQYTLNTSADASGLLALRSRIKTARGRTGLPDININDLVMFAVIKALLDMPDVNAELVDGKIYRRPEIHLGFACDTDRGLLVPVVKNCGSMPLGELSLKVKQLTEQALQGTIGADDLGGATFTVSNLGNLGIQSFTPIINPPQVAVLGVDTIEPKPVRMKSRVKFVDHIGLSLTCDHQVIDGAPGARFLKVLREKIEAIESLAGLDL